MVGLDRFHGMLRQARRKATDIDWVQADGARLPFPEESFDFISHQFAFHHVVEKPLMMAEVFRVLRPGGRFVMTNICPREMTGWAIYRYFPIALERDLQDFAPREEIRDWMLEIGFDRIKIELDHQEWEQDLREFVESVRRRDTCSQLITLSDADYQAGLRQIEMALLQAQGQTISVSSEICLLKVVAEKSAAVRIIDLDPEDEEAVRQTAALLVEGFREHWPNSWTDMTAALQEVHKSFQQGRISRVAVDEDGTVLGWIGGISEYKGNAWELHPLVVRSDRQRQGIGRALVTDLEERVRERGGYTIFLGTDDEDYMTTLSGIDLYPNVWEHIVNIRNLRGHPYEFYQKLGFVIVGVVPDANGPGKPDILMAKRVGE